MPASKRKEAIGPLEANAKSPLHTQDVMQGLVNQVAGYGVGAVITRFLGIVVAGIYPIFLSKDEYGRLDVIFSVTILLAAIFHLGLDSALSRYYYEHEDLASRRRLVSTVFWATMVLTMPVIVFLLLISKPLALWLYDDSRYILYFRLMLYGMIPAMAYSSTVVVLRLEQRIKAFNILSIANLGTTAVAGILSILIFRIGAAGVLVGFIVGNTITAVAAIWAVRQSIFTAPQRNYLGKLLNIGLPLVISGVATWLIGYANRPILAHRVHADDLGLYAIASGAFAMIAILFGAFHNAWQPFAFSIMGREGSGTVYGQALTLFTAVGALIATCAGLFAPYALLVINAYTHKDWIGAAPSIGLLALGIVFSTMYFVVQTGAYIARRTSIIAVTMGIAALVNIVLNFLLIPYFGILGAALATALGYLAGLIAVYVVAQRLAPIPYHPGKITLTILAASAAIAASLIFQSDTWTGDLLTRTAILAAFCSLLLISRTLTRSDFSLFRNISWLKPKDRASLNRTEPGPGL